MTEEAFEVSFSRGTARTLHTQATGDLANAFDWGSLDPSGYTPDVVERAQRFWTEAAFDEYRTGIAMGQLVQTLGEARVPIDLWSVACRFPGDEVVHVELCARMAMALGGASRIVYEPSAVACPLDPGLTPLQRANELVVRVCCVGETISVPLMSGSLKATTHPLARAVLTRIVRDEALHGRFGTMYLDWIACDFDDAERARLSEVASGTLRQFAPLWEPLEESPPHLNEGLGWMPAAEYLELATATVNDKVVAPLAGFGIEATPPWE